MRLSAFLEYTGRNTSRISSDGCVVTTPFCESVTAKSNPSSGVLVCKLSISTLQSHPLHGVCSTVFPAVPGGDAFMQRREIGTTTMGIRNRLSRSGRWQTRRGTYASSTVPFGCFGGSGGKRRARRVRGDRDRKGRCGQILSDGPRVGGLLNGHFSGAGTVARRRPASTH